MTHRLPLVLLATPLFWGQAIFAQADLQGIWSNATITPLERPADLAGKPTFTPQEAAAYEKQTVERNNVDHRTGNADADVASAYNQFWYDRGTKAVGTRRTSLIVDPPDGHLPALTPEGQKQAGLDAGTRDRRSGGPLAGRTLYSVGHSRAPDASRPIQQ
jgi:hypothetical protein